MTEGNGTPGPSEERGRGSGEGRDPAPRVFGPRARAAVSGDWVGIVANRTAGQGKGRAQVARLVKELRRRDLRPRVAWTPERRTAIVAEAVDDPRARCLVAVGGDGTVAGLVNERPSVPISVLPSGTENLFARHFHLAGNPAALAAAIADRRVFTMDLGRARGHRFSLMAGLGFDADVVTRHHLARVARTGLPRPTHRAMYVDPVLRSTLVYKFPPITVEIGGDGAGAGETLVGTSVFVFNLPRYALGLPFAPTARADDGMLDLLVFREPGPIQALRYLWLVLRGLHLDRPGVEHRRVRRVLFTSPDRVPVQLDGDPGGFLDAGGLTIDVEPHALDVVVPPGFG